MTLSQDIFRGLIWTGGSNLFANAINLVSIAILAHILSPIDFGLVGMVLTTTSFVTMIGDVGLGTAIIQAPSFSRSQLSTLFYFGVLQGLLLMVAVYLLAGPIASFFESSALISLIRFGSVVFVFIGCALLFRTLLQKDLRFKQLALVETAGSFCQGTVSIVCSLKGFGAYGLIAGFVARQFVELVLLWWIVGYRPVPVFRVREIAPMLKFGSYVLGERLLNYSNRNLDNILVGKFLGAEALGYYSLAYQMMFMCTSKISQVIGKVTYPAFSKIQDNNEKIRRAYTMMLKYISLAVFPLMGLMLVLARDIVVSVYGARWEPAIGVLQIFCFLGTIESIGSTVGGILYAKGRADIAFKYNIFNILVVATAIAAGLPYGIEGVAIALSAASVPLGYFWHKRTNALIDLSWRPFLESMEFSVRIAGLLALLALLCKLTMTRLLHVEVGLLTLIGVSSLALLTYVLLIAILKRSVIVELKQLVLSAFH